MYVNVCILCVCILSSKIKKNELQLIKMQQNEKCLYCLYNTLLKTWIWVSEIVARGLPFICQTLNLLTKKPHKKHILDFNFSFKFL